MLTLNTSPHSENAQDHGIWHTATANAKHHTRLLVTEGWYGAGILGANRQSTPETDRNSGNINPWEIPHLHCLYAVFPAVNSGKPRGPRFKNPRAEEWRPSSLHNFQL